MATTDRVQMLYHIATEIGASELALLSTVRGTSQQHLDTLLHVRPDESDPQTRNAAIAAVKEIVGTCIKNARDGVVEITVAPNGEGQSASPNPIASPIPNPIPSQAPVDRQYCLVTLSRRGAEVVGAAAFIVRRKSPGDASLALKRVQTGLADMP